MKPGSLSSRKRLISCLIMIVIKILVVRHTTESLQPGSFSLFICGNSNKVNFLLAHHSSFCLLIILKNFDIFLQQKSLISGHSNQISGIFIKNPEMVVKI